MCVAITTHFGVHSTITIVWCVVSSIFDCELGKDVTSRGGVYSSSPTATAARTRDTTRRRAAHTSDFTVLHRNACVKQNRICAGDVVCAYVCLPQGICRLATAKALQSPAAIARAWVKHAAWSLDCFQAEGQLRLSRSYSMRRRRALDNASPLSHTTRCCSLPSRVLAWYAYMLS